jgi:PAS domain-containing protein
MLNLEWIWEQRNRTVVLITSTAIILAIAVVDWWTKPYVSLGFLYLFPIMLAAGFLPRWGIVIMGIACALLSERFSNLDPTDAPIRASFEALALVGSGLFISEVLRNPRLRLASQERLRVLVETSPAAIVTVDDHGFIELANQAATELMAPRDGHLIGQPIAAYLPELHHALRWEEGPQFRTYTLNSVLKKIVQVLLLAIGLVMTGHAVLTPMLMVIVMITGDFLAMALTTDRVRPSPMPNSWQVGRITMAGVTLGGCFLAFCVAVLAVGKFEMQFGIEELRTLSVVAIVYGSQATIYALRGRRHLWGLRPTVWLLASSVADILIISTLAIRGIAMAPLPAPVLACEFGAAIIFGLILDGVKIPVFARLGIS